MIIAEASLPYFIKWDNKKILVQTLHFAVPAAYIWLA
jgi:hypothetical protein